MLRVSITFDVDDAPSPPETVSNVSVVVHATLKALKEAAPYARGGQAIIEIVNDKENPQNDVLKSGA